MGKPSLDGIFRIAFFFFFVTFLKSTLKTRQTEQSNTLKRDSDRKGGSGRKRRLEVASADSSADWI